MTTLELDEPDKTASSAGSHAVPQRLAKPKSDRTVSPAGSHAVPQQLAKPKSDKTASDSSFRGIKEPSKAAFEANSIAAGSAGKQMQRAAVFAIAACKWLAALAASVVLLFVTPAMLASAPSPLDSEYGWRASASTLFAGGHISDRAIAAIFVAVLWAIWVYLSVVFLIELLQTLTGIMPKRSASPKAGRMVIKPLVSTLMWSSTLSAVMASSAGVGGLAAILATQNQAAAMASAQSPEDLAARQTNPNASANSAQDLVVKPSSELREGVSPRVEVLWSLDELQDASSRAADTAQFEVLIPSGKGESASDGTNQGPGTKGGSYQGTQVQGTQVQGTQVQGTHVQRSQVQGSAMQNSTVMADSASPKPNQSDLGYQEVRNQNPTSQTNANSPIGKPGTQTPGADTQSVVAGRHIVQHSESTQVIQVALDAESTLWDLASRYLGDGLRWQELAELNGLSPQEQFIAAGSVLKLPAVTVDNSILPVSSYQVEEADITSKPDENQVGKAEGHGIDVVGNTHLETQNHEQSDFQQGLTYRQKSVELGDSLWTMTADSLKDILGKEPSVEQITQVWQQTLEQNTSQLRSKNPDLIYPGEQVQIVSLASNSLGEQLENTSTNLNADSHTADDSLAASSRSQQSNQVETDLADSTTRDLADSTTIASDASGHSTHSLDPNANRTAKPNAAEKDTDTSALMGSAPISPAPSSLASSSPALSSSAPSSPATVSAVDEAPTQGENTSSETQRTSESNDEERSLLIPAVLSSFGGALLARGVHQSAKQRRDHSLARRESRAHNLKTPKGLGWLSNLVEKRSQTVEELSWQELSRGFDANVLRLNDRLELIVEPTKQNPPENSLPLDDRVDAHAIPLTLLIGSDDQNNAVFLNLEEHRKVLLKGSQNLLDDFVETALCELAMNDRHNAVVLAVGCGQELNALKRIRPLSSAEQVLPAIELLRSKGASEEKHATQNRDLPVLVISANTSFTNEQVEAILEAKAVVLATGFESETVLAITETHTAAGEKSRDHKDPAQMAKCTKAARDQTLKATIGKESIGSAGENAEPSRTITATLINSRTQSHACVQQSVIEVPLLCSSEEIDVLIDLTGAKTLSEQCSSDTQSSQLPEHDEAKSRQRQNSDIAALNETQKQSLTGPTKAKQTAKPTPETTAQMGAVTELAIGVAAHSTLGDVQEPLFDFEALCGKNAKEIPNKTCNIPAIPQPPIRLLGRAEIDTVKPLNSLKAVEAIALLAMQRQGKTAAQLQELLWAPWETSSTRALANVLSRARCSLGVDEHAKPWLSKAGSDGIYRLDPAINSDIEVFQDLQRAARDAHRQGNKTLETQLLGAALSLVRGAPFSGGEKLQFVWADNFHRTNTVLAVDESAHRLTDIALENDDVELARWALSKSQLVLEQCDGCFKRRFEIAAYTKNRLELERTMGDLEAITKQSCDVFGLEVNPELIELYENFSRDLKVQALS